MIKKVLLIAIIAIAVIITSCSDFKCSSSKKEYIIGFYNVENLFDTINDPETRDGDFTPKGKVPWNTERYQRKLDHISKVIASLDSRHLPDIMGLCEVENRLVLEDLIEVPHLKKGNYRIIHTNSPDERGIDNALIYRKDRFTPLFDTAFPVIFPYDTSDRTRDILFVKGLINKDTLNIFVNHWPSRYGGQKKSEPDRNHTAFVLRTIIDSLFAVNPHSNLLIMGDFNDNPDNASLQEILEANKVKGTLESASLYNLSYNKYLNDEGTIYWRSWDMFDQIIVSTSLLDNKKGLKVKEQDQHIFKPDWILYFPDRGSPRPNRTKGRNYYGGYSDHLPVYVRLKK